MAELISGMLGRKFLWTGLVFVGARYSEIGSLGSCVAVSKVSFVESF